MIVSLSDDQIHKFSSKQNQNNQEHNMEEFQKSEDIENIIDRTKNTNYLLAINKQINQLLLFIVVNMYVRRTKKVLKCPKGINGRSQIILYHVCSRKSGDFEK